MPFTKDQLKYAGNAALRYMINKQAAPFPDLWKDSIPLWHRELMDQMARSNFSNKCIIPTMLGTKITGNKISGMILDDPHAEYNHGVKFMPKVKPIKKDYNTIGVRFIYGHSLGKIYTYKIRKGAKVHLGQEVVVPSTQVVASVAVVVEIHKTPQDTGPFNYLFVSGKVAPL